MSDETTQESGQSETKAPSIPEGEYAAVMLSVGELEESKKEKTVFRNVVFKITEEGPYKGKQIAWTAFFSEKAAQRSFEAFIGSGCAFGAGEDDFSGHGTREQVVVVKHEPFSFTPQPSESNPSPREVSGVRARVAFVNNGVRGMAGERVSESRKAVLKPQLQAMLAKARSGDRSTGPDAQGNRVDAGGTLRDKAGKALY